VALYKLDYHYHYYNYNNVYYYYVPMTSRLMIDIADEMGEMIDLFVLHLDL